MIDGSRKIAILTGNGASMAVAENLGLNSLTNEVLRRFDSNVDAEAGEGDSDFGAIGNALKKLAAADPNINSTHQDFEALVGVLDDLEAGIRTLHPLQQVVSDEARNDLEHSIAAVEEFVRRVHNIGVIHVLEVIRQRTVGLNNKSFYPTTQLIRDATAGFPGGISVGNLNYDQIMMKSILNVWKGCKDTFAFSDLANWSWKDVANPAGLDEKEFLPLRPDHEHGLATQKGLAPLELIHLHGSMTWWQPKDCEQVVKMRSTKALNKSWWQVARSENADMSPMVVLANSRRKTEQVKRFPFNVAYSAFANRLAGANHWLIVGYSFRDAALNEVLASSMREFYQHNQVFPKILVSTFGNDLNGKLVESVLSSAMEDIELAEDAVVIDRSGLGAFVNSPDWARFAQVEVSDRRKARWAKDTGKSWTAADRPSLRLRASGSNCPETDS